MGRRPNRTARIKPFFVKVLFRGFLENLLIPRKYVSLHRQTLGKECVLWPTHTRDLWRVRTKRIDNELYFKKGWDAFAKHHSLEFGDLLIFRHVQNSEFDVDMVDMTGTPRELVISQNDQLLSDVDAARVSPSNTGLQKRTIIETTALTEAETLISRSEFPSFKKTMKQSYVTPGGYLHVPVHYAKEYMKDCRRNVIIELSDKAWTVQVLRRPGETRTFLGCGWSDLANESNLRVGDVCVFHLMSTKDNTLSLTVFRHTIKQKKTILEAGQQEKTTLEAAAITAAEALISSSEFPCFKKIMKPAYVKPGGRLHVPVDYANEHMKGSTVNMKIELSDKAWIVTVLRHRSCETKTFLNGWSDLARENSLQVGDVCVFELINTKDYTLELTIFRHTSGKNQKNKQIEAKSYSKLTTKSKNPFDKAFEEAKKFQSISKHPSFVTVMRPAYVQHGYLHVPKTFIKEMREEVGGSEVKLQSSDKEWKAIIRRVGGQWRIYAGWVAFVKDRSVEVGDVCVLELINREDDVIRISIFKCNS